MDGHDWFGLFMQFERTVMKTQFALIRGLLVLRRDPQDTEFGNVA
jgi:hypothetical protein